ncbi:MDR family MFS transporter [Serinibacter arcticus]|uniref:MDR family MFS transporter n=1 Tax=Serinibacter arcticus TaxID=1655435 RepID=UPI001F41CA94|nr:MDR family MFS transporter [Serinibacter arcticus]
MALSATEDDQHALTNVAASSDRLPRPLKLVIGLLLAGAFVMILNETIMSVALPTLMVEFSVDAATAQWLTTGYLLTMAVVIPTTGLMLQRYSTRAVFVAALTLFTIGTLLCAVAPSFSLLVAGRVVQAIGTAIILPLMTTTVLTLVPVSRRGSTMGLISIVIAVAPAVGPTFSGFILDSLGWQWMFLTVLPIALVVLAVGAVLVKDFSARRSTPFDALSVVLSAVGFGGLVFGLSAIGKGGSTQGSMSPIVPLIAGVVALAVFVLRQISLQRRDAALLDLRPFRVRAFSLGIVMIMVSMLGLFGTLILLPIYLQQVMGLGTLQTGLALLPGGLAMGILAPFVGRAYDRIGPRPLVVPGSFVVALALLGMYLLNDSSTLTQIITTHVVLNIGLGLVMTPLLTTTLGSLRSELYSHGSAITNTLQQLAGAAGTALFITVMTAVSNSALSEGTDPVAAQAAGIHAAFLWGAVLAAIAALLSFTVKRAANPAPSAPCTSSKQTRDPPSTSQPIQEMP